jgi:hypothetical protein
VAVKTSDEALKLLKQCESPLSKSFFVQRGVPNIVQYNGRTTQGRAYLLISNLKPATVWLFMGYFNVAARSSSSTPGVEEASSESDEGKEEGEEQGVSAPLDKSAYVTNMRTNQKSERILLTKLLEGRSRDELRTVKGNIKEAALTAFLALKRKLGEYGPGFSIFGFDYVIQEDMNVKLLETNCNCELFAASSNAGPVRVAISTHLVQGAMDIALASKLNPHLFRALLEEFTTGEATEKGTALMMDGDESLEMDASPTKPRQSWELLYTEAVSPPYSIMNLKETCTPL